MVVLKHNFLFNGYPFSRHQRNKKLFYVGLKLSLLLACFWLNRLSNALSKYFELESQEQLSCIELPKTLI